MRRRPLRALILLLVTGACFTLWFVEADTLVNYSFGPRGGVSLITLGGAGTATIGYARIQPNSGSPTPSGIAIFALRQSGILVSEASVPASPPRLGGRIYAEVNGPVNTGVAIANPGAQAATVSFYFTNSSGVNFGNGTTTIQPNSQIAAFLDQAPFNGGNSLTGAFTFSSSVPVSVIALRGFTNERSEFLITTLPVVELSTPGTQSRLIPHFADGGGWTTQAVLVNPTDNAVSGNVQFFSQGSSTQAGQSVNVTVNGVNASSFAYTVAPRSSIRLQTLGQSANTAVGSIRVTPSPGDVTPSALAIFSFKNAGITVSEAAAAALPAGRAFRLYAEASSASDSILSGVAVANPSSSPVAVRFELTTLTENPTGLTGTVTIPANGQLARFLDQITGLESLPRPFKGMLRISLADISVVGLRSHVNERGDFLITTTPPVDENAPAPSSEAVFPHLADNGGYTTQFILYNGGGGQTSSGSLRIYAQNGQPLDLKFAPYTDLVVTQSDAPDPVGVGNNISYSITVTNNGPSVARGARLNDVLPSGVTFVSVNASQGSCQTPAGGLLACSLGDVGAGSTVAVTLVVRSVTAGALSNSVWAAANEDDPASSNNQSTVTTSVRVSSDLGITQDGPPTCYITACNNLIYTITVTNQGPAAAPDVSLIDVLPTDPPSGVTVATLVSAAPSQGVCSTASAGQFNCVLGTLSSGSTTTVKVVLAIDSTALGRVVSNRVTVSGGIADTNPVNDTDEQPTTVYECTVLPRTYLEVTGLTGNPASLQRGGILTFTATVHNIGPSTATQAVVDVTFSGLSQMPSLVSATSTKGVCSSTAGGVSCNVGTLLRTTLSPFPEVITIVVRPTVAGMLSTKFLIRGNPQERDHAGAVVCNPPPTTPDPNKEKTVSTVVN